MIALSDEVRLIDIGANLGHTSFAHDFEAVLQRARESGVHHLVITGSSLAESARAIELANRHPSVLSATVGLHPHAASDWTDDTLECLRELLSDPRVVAVGEAGLDFYRDLSPRNLQVQAFEAQLQLAAQTSLPLFLHERDAHDEFAAVVRNARESVGKIVVHCFTGNTQQLRTYLDLDLHIGITGWICDQRRGSHLRELVRFIPSDRMMLETDSPYLLPRDIVPLPKSRRNEPMFLRHVASVVAESCGCSLRDLATTTTTTAQRFFGIESEAVSQAESF